MKNSTKVIIESLSELAEPSREKKCGYIIQRLYEAIARPNSGLGNISFNVIKHNNHKAEIQVYYPNISDFVALKEYLLRNYAENFNWRETKWLVK